ncbi:MAG: SRPBCC family protein [Bacteroidota bacterium]|nr:SRPBCC family protein [Rhodothermia bacterium]MCS7155259.1 SRPBCC family protein [Bacteroidota bacterium]MDW8138663.1 SRPBCC family protein [Bacteroidota bacterium]MDW8284751.1 SRPBCC family protein [Bacteroidota bacterium]
MQQVVWLDFAIRAPIDAVYGVFTDPRSWPRGLLCRRSEPAGGWSPGAEFELRVLRYRGRFWIAEHEPPFSWVAEQREGACPECVLGLQCHPLRGRLGTRVHLELSWISKPKWALLDRWLLRPWLGWRLWRWAQGLRRDLEGRYGVSSPEAL